MKVLKLGQDLGYQFQKHALDKVEHYQKNLDEFYKHTNLHVQSYLLLNFLWLINYL